MFKAAYQASKRYEKKSRAIKALLFFLLFTVDLFFILSKSYNAGQAGYEKEHERHRGCKTHLQGNPAHSHNG
jgi:hypothetical protein